MQKLLTIFSKNISVYAIFNDQSFKDTLTNDIVSFEQLGLDFSNLQAPKMAPNSQECKRKVTFFHTILVLFN